MHLCVLDWAPADGWRGWLIGTPRRAALSSAASSPLSFFCFRLTFHQLASLLASWQGGNMQTIVVASQKGGAGKTTTARHLAVEAERQGEGPVALIDVDPQGGLARWWNRREAETPVFV